MIVAILAAATVAATKLRYQWCSHWLLGEDLCQTGLLVATSSGVYRSSGEELTYMIQSFVFLSNSLVLTSIGHS